MQTYNIELIFLHMKKFNTSQWTMEKFWLEILK